MTIFSYEYTLFQCSPSLKVESKYWGGRKLTATARANMTGLIGGSATLANSQVALWRIPAGAIITGGQAHWEGPAGSGSGLGTGAAFVIGDSFNCARFLTLTNAATSSEGLYAQCGTFNVCDFNPVPMNQQYLNVEYSGILYEYTCDTDMLLTLASGPATGAQGHVRVVIDYSVV